MPTERKSLLQRLAGVTATEPPNSAVAALLKQAGTIVECELRGASMGAMLPHLSQVRVQFERAPRLAIGDVIAFAAGSGVTIHRIVGRGAFGPARSFVLTRGDGCVLVDHPVPASAVLGVAREVKRGDGWEPVPAFRAAGWRRPARALTLWPVVVALHVHRHVATLVTSIGFTLRAVGRKAGVVGGAIGAGG